MDQEEIRLEMACAAKEQEWNVFEASIKKPATKSPIIPGLPDHGLSGLSPERDAWCARRCREFGVDYEQVKADFLANCQVIGARAPNPISTALASKGVVPQNDVNMAMVVFVSAHINALERTRIRIRREISQGLGVHSHG